MTSDRCQTPSSYQMVRTAVFAAGAVLLRLSGATERAQPRGVTTPFGPDLFDKASRGEAMRHLSRHVDGHKPVCIVNVHVPRAGTDNTWAEFADDNRAGYAAHQGYSYFGFRGRVSGSRFVDSGAGGLDDVAGGGLTWQKMSAVAAVATEMTPEGLPRCAWMMWMDADAIFTNWRMTVESLVHNFAERSEVTKHVLISSEEIGYPGNFVNSGAFLVRNSWAGRAFLSGVVKHYEKYKASNTNDQDAISEYIFQRSPQGMVASDWGLLQAHTRAEVAVLPQRAMNSFSWNSLPLVGRWQQCDFVAHFLQASPNLRIEGMQEMMKYAHLC